MMTDNMTKGLISKEVVEASAGEYAEATQWLREALNSQRAFLRANRDRAAKRAFYAQTTVIALGFIASLAAIFSKASTEIWPWGGTNYWSLANVVIPLLISAVTALIALYDFRGAYARNSTAYSAVSAIKSEIDYRILLGYKDATSHITRPMLEAWEQRTSVAVSEHAQAWERSMTDKKSKD
jgi:hypothetical protein